MRRKTAFSRRNCTEDQLTRSLIRDAPDCERGERWLRTSVEGGSALPAPDQLHEDGDEQTDGDPSEGGPDEVEDHPARGHRGGRTPGQACGGDGRAQGDESRRVVDERLALEDRDDPPRQADGPAHRCRRHRVGRCHHRPQCEGNGEGDGEQPPHEQPDAGRSEEHQTDRQPEDRMPITCEIHQRGLEGGGIQQRRQDAEEDDVGTERDLRDEREVRADDPDEDEHERRRQAEACRDPATDEHGATDGQERDRGLHGLILPVGVAL
jgi:hypothetical protein